MPVIDLVRLNRFLGKVKLLIDEKIAEISTPTPWKYQYIADGDVLGMVRDIDSQTVTKNSFPYKVVAPWIIDESNAYHDTTNETYAQMPTTTTERTAKIYIDTQIPETVSNMTISFKVGTSNISPSVWNKRSYVVKCGGVTLGSGDLVLKTMGNIVTLNVAKTSVSPIVEIDITAQTTMEQYVRIFGAEVSATYNATKKWVSMIRNDQFVRS